MHIDRRGYAYETYRRGGKVCRRYVGSGPAIPLIIRLEELDRDREEMQRRHAANVEQAEREQARELAEPLERLWLATESIFRAAMEANGYHLHARGAWRKRRHPMSNTEIKSQPNGDRLTVEEVKSLVEKARNGDTDAARAVWANMEDKPEAQAFFMKAFGELGHIAQAAYIEKMTGEDRIFFVTLVRKSDDLRDELQGPSPTPLERMLVERIVTCWIQINYFEYHIAEGIGKQTITQAEHQQRRLDAAHRRHLQAIKALAQVRRLQLPALVQINLNGQPARTGRTHEAGAT